MLGVDARHRHDELAVFVGVGPLRKRALDGAGQRTT